MPDYVIYSAQVHVKCIWGDVVDCDHWVFMGYRTVGTVFSGKAVY